MESKLQEESKLKESMGIVSPSNYSSEMTSFQGSEYEKSKRRTIKKILL